MVPFITIHVMTSSENLHRQLYIRTTTLAQLGTKTSSEDLHDNASCPLCTGGCCIIKHGRTCKRWLNLLHSPTIAMPVVRSKASTV